MAHGPRGRSSAHRRQVGMNPDILSQIQASLSAEVNPKPPPVATPDKPKDTPKPPAPTPPAAQTTKPAPAPAASTTPKAAAPPPPSSAPPAPTTSQPAPQATGKVGAPLPAPPPSSSSARASSSSAVKSSLPPPSTRSSSSAVQGIRTVTPKVSAAPTAPPATASSSSGLSGGSIAGIAIGLIAGIIVIGGVAGWLYRKYKERNYDNNASAWTKMNDDNGVTPYRNDPKTNASDEEFYSGLPPAGSMQSQAFQPPPQHGYYADNGMRPDSMAAMENNMAGYGSGVRSGPYPDPAPVAVAYDANGRPYTPTQQNGQWGYDHHQQEQYAPNPFDDANRMSPLGSLHSPNSPHHQQNFGGPRQLVGPGQTFAGVAPVPALAPAPVPLGRPQPPQSYDDIAAAEMYADDRYADDHMAAPPHLGHFGQQQPGNFPPESFATAEARHSGSGMPQDLRAISPVTSMPASIIHPPQPLPTMQPMSPLISPVALSNDDDSNHMYDEVARAAGVPSPSATAPLSPGSPQQQQQAFLPPVVSYQHGVPLSPLVEVPTPASSTMPLMPDGLASAETSFAQRVAVPTASPSIVTAVPVIVPAAAPVPRPLPAIPQQQTVPSPTPASAPGAPISAPNQAHARTDSLDDAYGGI
ncbi:hypothetical protein CcaverHIS002_0109860 [Cutaneotrichosporon cavernicola]|uniref:Uncharacterized protein n=1 Tax=Cutaneotrichosporon cavernicola TaxID=279322 RepID=A0AA48I714_9TREE|nr:uncharacterized protein CcaverHIS019_0109780 [Cutaneotrichosporon cavernicola]BEI80457.1 hypothetical protein CcaverHIS002_0109860 [Cutaneotrichosporon cavernicola]BEI88260.1 hypothetical protein CcaverHIS019_0109780 [Cutaneotrichosporon cavernicola]BEI96032.1 hypothetical protein CcaverHIS631_0109810 [Cutaneotrichosporon cavernicola]BEJ03805.1 hypothetical protein CcaverHIS641_0109800 [Cutaneotrichosporon cavernicola]